VYGVGVISSDVTYIPGLVANELPVLQLKMIDTRITQYLTSLMLSTLKETVSTHLNCYTRGQIFTKRVKEKYVMQSNTTLVISFC
jgi:hypothetical protein